MKGCETRPTVYRPYPRRLESLTICRCHYKGSTFFSVSPFVFIVVGLNTREKSNFNLSAAGLNKIKEKGRIFSFKFFFVY